VSFSDLHPVFRPWAVALYRGAERAGLNPRVTSTYRSIAEQRILYNRRNRVLSGELPSSAQPFPVAVPGRSRHNHRAAFDMVVDRSGRRLVADVWRSWGGFWTEGDSVHYGDIG
jgi:hypothetical protein